MYTCQHKILFITFFSSNMDHLRVNVCVCAHSCITFSIYMNERLTSINILFVTPRQPRTAKNVLYKGKNWLCDFNVLLSSCLPSILIHCVCCVTLHTYERQKNMNNDCAYFYFNVFCIHELWCGCVVHIWLDMLFTEGLKSCISSLPNNSSIFLLYALTHTWTYVRENAVKKLYTRFEYMNKKFGGRKHVRKWDVFSLLLWCQPVAKW